MSGSAFISHPPGPCPFLANWTRCSGVKSINSRDGSGGRSIWPGWGRLVGPGAEPVWEALGKESALFGSKLGPRGVLMPTSMLDLWEAGVRPAVRASHNPPAASSAAIARNRCFAFIVFCFLIPASPSLSLRIVREFPGVGFRFGTKARNSGAKRHRTGMNLIPSRVDYPIEIGVRGSPTAASITQERVHIMQVLETFREMESSGLNGTPVFAGFRESDAWWNSSFRSSARPGSRPRTWVEAPGFGQC